jgi:NAD(P)-dependent dehydrogenase (short-subunit alcohol dehydrogenase family)
MDTGGQGGGADAPRPEAVGSVSLEGRTVVLVGGGGITRGIARRVVAAGGEVVLAGRDPAKIAPVSAELGPKATSARVDLGDEESVRTLADQVGRVDHLVSLASAPANGPVAGLDRAAVVAAFDAKVIGPILLAKHFATRFREGGSLLLFSGLAAWRPAPGRVVMATANGAVDFLARALAVELAPVRVNALSPGVVDSGSWDALGAARDTLFARTAETNPARRIGYPDDIAQAALLAMTNPFLTGTTLHVDGGGRLA